jgi:hypothetical protein
LCDDFKYLSNGEIINLLEQKVVVAKEQDNYKFIYNGKIFEKLTDLSDFMK